MNDTEQRVHFAPSIEDIQLERVIGKIENKESSKLAVITTGVHGNEPSSLFAAKKVMRKIELSKLKLKGTLLMLTGNINALQQDVRFIDEDLNRLWEEKRIQSFIKDPKTSEEKEAKEMYEAIEPHIGKYSDRFFLDCHTTSSQTMPYISADDQVDSYQFAQQFPVHTVVGFSKHVAWSLNDFFRDEGFSGFTFEAGHHHAFTSLENHEAMIWLFLCKSGLIDPDDLEDKDQCRSHLAKYAPDGACLFQIQYHHKLVNRDDFVMNPGYVNFQKIKKGEHLAVEQEKEVVSHLDGRILMPLYQKLGADGFFIITPHHYNN
tara:strand:+ start:2032 stop:2988 length:957 start_codon:yes stop_codon:yes gene_type:complete